MELFGALTFGVTFGITLGFGFGIPIGMTFGVLFEMVTGLTEKLADLDGFADTIGGIFTDFVNDGDRDVFGSKADLIEGLVAAASNGSFTVGRDGVFVGNEGNFLPGLVRIIGFPFKKI